MEEDIVRAPRAAEKQKLARRIRRQSTPAEDLLWQRLRGNKLLDLHFQRQQVIDGLIVDFYCREVRLVIECDGIVHEMQADYDQERERILGQRNLDILRFKNAQIEQQMESVLGQIAHFARQRLSEKYQA
jgi:very-short-patch-repair endonuclease